MTKKRKKKKGKQIHFDSLKVNDYKAVEYLMKQEEKGVNVDMFAFQKSCIDKQLDKKQNVRRKYGRNLKKECGELLKASETSWNVTSIDTDTKMTIIEG